MFFKQTAILKNRYFADCNLKKNDKELKDFILDNIGNYIYTRARINNYKVEGREKSINQLDQVI